VITLYNAKISRSIGNTFISRNYFTSYHI
jgi:hypothetical protein